MPHRPARSLRRPIRRLFPPLGNVSLHRCPNLRNPDGRKTRPSTRPIPLLGAPHHCILNGGVNTGAGSYDDVATFYYGNAATPTIFTHEAAHSADKGFAGREEFTNAYEMDTCIPDNCAASAPHEDFAQVVVAAMAMMNAGSTAGFDPMSCMSNQIAAVWATFGSQSTVEGGLRCDLAVRQDDSPTVAWVWAEGKKMARRERL